MIGQTLSHYKIVEKLGAGGMGEVYLAEDSKLKRQVALKVLPPEMAASEERLERFQREAETLAALDHPNIVSIYSVEEADEVRFLTMQLVEGKRLSELIPKGGMSLERIFEIAVPLTDALAAAHEKGVIHRDLKPGNIMVTNDGRVKVLDFGLAKLRAEAARQEATELPTEPLTDEGRILGTVPYMSPEQLEGKPVDARTDIFSLGVILFEMATGERPFKGETQVSIMSSLMRDTPPEIDTLRTDLPHHLARVIRRCLEKRLQRRFQSALDVRNELEALHREIESGSLAPSSAIPARAPVKAPRWKPMAITLATLLLVAIGAFVLWRGRARPPAETSAQQAVGRKMIVVLPFDNLGRAEDEYFAAGMTEEVTNRLAAISGLGVISRNSANQYANTDKTTRQIGDELGVDYLLEGTVRWSYQPEGSSRVRITQQLVSVADDTQLWADSFDRQLEDIFEVQSEIATMVVNRLGVTLLERERGRIADRPTDNLEAYQELLRAQFLRAKTEWFYEDNLRARVKHLERAIELDPGFGQAWLDVARTHGTFYSQGHDKSETRKEMARHATEQAAELAPDSFTTHLARATYAYHIERDFDRVLEEIAIAEKDRPGDRNVQLFRASALRHKGRFEEAAKIRADLFRLDPRSPHHAQWLGDAYRHLRQYSEALRYYELAITIAPDEIPSYGSRARLHWAWRGDTAAARESLEAAPGTVEGSELVHDWFWQLIYEGQHGSVDDLLRSSSDEWLGKPVYRRPKALLAGFAHRLVGEHERARTSFESAAAQLEAELLTQPDNPALHSSLGVTYAALGREDEAVREGIRATEITPLSEQPFFATVHIEDLAWIYTLVGDREAALDQIEILLSRPSHISVRFLQLDPRWNALRGHPRFQALLEKYK